MSAKPRAFTLLEVLLVILLVAVVMGLAWPNLAAVTRAEALTESAQRLKSLVAMCRAESMNEARRYRIAIRPDGTVRVTRQLDAVKAPHVFVPFQTPWTREDYVLPDAWVEAVLPLPTGPSPIDVTDELVEFEQFDELIPVQELDTDAYIHFEPDGASESMRWVMRDSAGRGLRMTLDGRLGRLMIETVDVVNDPERPPEAPEEPEVDVEALTARYLENTP